MRLVAGAILLLLLAAVAYTAWPLIDLYQLADAVRSRDTAALLERVDLPAVRKSIARQILDRASKGKIEGVKVSVDPAGQEIAANLLEAKLEEVITPEMVFDLLLHGRPRVDDGAAAPGRGGGPSPYSLPLSPLSRLKGLGFATPGTFRISFGEGSDPGDWLTLTLTLLTSPLVWQLSAVNLPDRVFNRLRRDIHIEISGAR